jgi:hypothetical protein
MPASAESRQRLLDEDEEAAEYEEKPVQPRPFRQPSLLGGAVGLAAAATLFLAGFYGGWRTGQGEVRASPSFADALPRGEAGVPLLGCKMNDGG